MKSLDSKFAKFRERPVKGKYDDNQPEKLSSINNVRKQPTMNSLS